MSPEWLLCAQTSSPHVLQANHCLQLRMLYLRDTQLLLLVVSSRAGWFSPGQDNFCSRGHPTYS